MSNVTLRTEEYQLLLCGLKHLIHPLQANQTDILTTFDFTQLTMSKDFRHEKESTEVKTKISKFPYSLEILINQYCMLLENIEF